ncbi:hypothetical protein chiPu_0020232, partial [Chiloscyllium punctatum]|nr:hypothetical protein [Chiloscyllium punctatum]
MVDRGRRMRGTGWVKGRWRRAGVLETEREGGLGFRLRLRPRPGPGPGAGAGE